MINDQKILLEMVGKINKTIPENKINDIYNYIKTKLKS